MNISTLSVLSLLTASFSLSANTSIDFVFPTTNGKLDKTISTRCSAGESQFSGETLERAIRFNVPKMLQTKNAGQYAVTCTTDYLGETYTFAIKAIKFHRSEYGSYAPSYDAEGFGTGVSLTKRQSDCYDRTNLVFNQECLNKFYGDKEYYLQGYIGESDTQWHFDNDYTSAIGVFIVDNPLN